MNELQKDILTATMFIIGLVGFISGEFIISSALFASAAITSNVNLNDNVPKLDNFDANDPLPTPKPSGLKTFSCSNLQS